MDIRRFETVASTNDEARAWAREGAPDGSFVIARGQSGGRGRRGRSWASPPGLGFYGSLIVRPSTWGGAGQPAGPPQVLGRYTLGASVGITRALDGLGVRALLKWPNDVLLGGKKIAGVLCEAEWSGDAPAFLIIGVGLNVAHAAADLPERPVFPASSLLIECGHHFEPARVESALISALRDVANEIAGGGWDVVRRAWEERCAGRGEVISVSNEGRKYFGVLRGLDPSGALLVATTQGLRSVAVGDVAFE